MAVLSAFQPANQYRRLMCCLVACVLAILLIFFQHKVAPFVFLVAFIRMAVERFDYKSPIVVFIAPWFLLYGFISLPITEYSRIFDDITLDLMLVPVLSAVILGVPVARISTTVIVVDKNCASTMQTCSIITGPSYRAAIIILFTLFAVNVIYSGFIPLINIIMGAGSDYLDYGVKGLNGLFYAYSNSIAMLSYYLFLRTSKRKYLVNIFIVFVMFILCVTRQNIVSLAVELLIMHAFIREPISKPKLLFGAAIAIFAFGIIGDIRSGDIRELMGLLPVFDSLPTAFIWLYAYSFFNILNLDNLVMSHEYGFLDASSLASLIPSFIRPETIDHSDLIEVPSFTISSYIQPILIDVGPLGVVLFTVIVVALTNWVYRRALIKRDFNSVAIYCVLYFCGLFSFFVNFWLYLPIIFQIPFIAIFARTMLNHDKT